MRTTKPGYVATWSVNNNSTYGTIYGYNKSQLRDDVREICCGNVFAGDSGHWSVYNVNDPENAIYSGTVRR